MLIDKIKADSLVARKERNTLLSNLLTTLYSEAAMVGKNDGNRETTDVEVVAVVKKFIKNAVEVLKVRNDADTVYEVRVLESYLPKQLTEEQLVKYISDYKFFTPNANVGQIMKYLKEDFSGQYDAKLASQLAKGN